MSIFLLYYTAVEELEGGITGIALSLKVNENKSRDLRKCTVQFLNEANKVV